MFRKTMGRILCVFALLLPAHAFGTPSGVGTPYFSAMNLANAGGTSRTIAMDGMVRNYQVGGVLNTQFASQTPAQVRAILEGGAPPNSYSAEFVFSVVPEPATLALTGLALLGLGLFSLRGSTRR